MKARREEIFSENYFSNVLVSAPLLCSTFWFYYYNRKHRLHFFQNLKTNVNFYEFVREHSLHLICFVGSCKTKL